MNLVATFAIYAWLPVVLGLFLFFKPRTAVLIGIFAGWMFLPERAGVDLPLLPPWTKYTGTNLSVLTGVILFCPHRLTGLRWRWWDLFMVAWVLVPMASSVSNGIGGGTATAIYGGLTLVLQNAVVFGVPYLIGRAMFRTADDLRALVVALFAAGLVYVPLCLIEMRLTPQLHRWVYGSHAHAFGQAKRMGGFRPTVFMQHGLMVGFFMTAATLAGWWCWRGKLIRKIGGMPVGWALLLLTLVTLNCRSAGRWGC